MEALTGLEGMRERNNHCLGGIGDDTRIGLMDSTVPIEALLNAE